MKKKYRKILEYPELVIGLIMIMFFLIWGGIYFIYCYLYKGTFSSPYIPDANMRLELSPPMENGFLLGSDIYGRSLVELISEGLIYSMLFSISVTVAAAIIGLIVGYCSARFEGKFSIACDMLINIIFIFPSILIAIIVMSIVGNSWPGLMMTLIMTGWAGYARIVKGEAKRVLILSYVEGAKAIGMQELGLFVKIIIPAIAPQLLIHMVLGLGGVIISESTLGFLGLGGSEYSWGKLLLMSKSVLLEAPYLVFLISCVMSSIIISLNLVGDGFRDLLDPQKKNKKGHYMNKMGQLFITGISGKELSTEEKNFLRDYNIGGVILFSHNYENPTQLATLVNEIQSLRDEYPLFVSVDQEGGRVQRFKNDFIHFPAMGELARVSTPKIVYEVHKIIAEELSRCGVNLNFSPCCDILSNSGNVVIGDRAFGNDKETVGKFITSAIRGLQSNGVLSVAKHFPGHGHTREDSHDELPISEDKIENILEREIYPFSKAIKSRVEFIMMGHLLIKSLDEKYPASLSRKTYEILRKDMRFTKIIITDDMEMKALDSFGSVGDVAVQALTAGCDILLYRSMDKAKLALEAVNQSIKKKILKMSDINEKLARVENCKKNHFKNYQMIYIPSVKENTCLNSKVALLEEIKKKIQQK